MCKYCERLPNVNFCESIADTGFDNCSIMYDNNDVAYIGLSANEFISSEPISFCPFCGKNLVSERIIEDEEPEYEQISESDIVVGDYVCIDGESSFCSFGRHKIDKILTKYDEDTGEKYIVYLDMDGNKWNSKTRRCMNALYAYDIVGFCRRIN